MAGLSHTGLDDYRAAVGARAASSVRMASVMMAVPVMPVPTRIGTVCVRCVRMLSEWRRVGGEYRACEQDDTQEQSKFSKHASPPRGREHQ